MGEQKEVLDMTKDEIFYHMQYNIVPKVYNKTKRDTKCLELVLKELDENSKWIPIVTRSLTEEEKEYYQNAAYTYIYDCRLPEDGDDVLVTTRYGGVDITTFFSDDGCYFENYEDDGDVIAWMPLPKPYEKGVKR